MNQCPVHDEVTKNHERRMDDLKELSDKALECVDEIKKNCQDARKDCQAAMWDGINARPRQATLMWFAGIALTIVVIVFGLYSSKISSSLDSLHTTDVEVKKALADDKKLGADYREAMTDKVQDIYIMMIQLGGSPPKRMKERQEK